jgi:hypothetical protein
MYPFALALIWPVIYEALLVNCFEVATAAAGHQTQPLQTASGWTRSARQRFLVVVATILICASTTLIASPSFAPVRNFKLAKNAERKATLLLITFLGHDQHHRLDLKVSRSVAAVGSSEIKKTDVVPKWILAVNNPPSGNGVLFHASARDACDALRFASENGFDRSVKLGKSNVFAAFRSNHRTEVMSALQEFNRAELRLAEANFPAPFTKKMQSCITNVGQTRSD